MEEHYLKKKKKKSDGVITRWGNSSVGLSNVPRTVVTSWLRKVTVQFYIWGIGAWEHLTRPLYLLVYFNKLVREL